MKAYKIPNLTMRMVKESTLSLPTTKARDGNDAAAIAHRMIGESPVERVIIIALDGGSNVTGVSQIAQGGMHGCGLTVRDVLRAALAMQASGFILAHNHPSGNPQPSYEDIEMTRRVRDGAAVVGLSLLDHIIVTRDAKTFVCGWSE